MLLLVVFVTSITSSKTDRLASVHIGIVWVSFALNVHIFKTVRTSNDQVKHYKMGRVLKSNSIAKTQNTESHETRENNETTWQTRIHRSAVQFASTFVGQAIMMQFFKLLWTLEKSANWISNGKTGKNVLL